MTVNTSNLSKFAEIVYHIYLKLFICYVMLLLQIKSCNILIAAKKAEVEREYVSTVVCLEIFEF